MNELGRLYRMTEILESVELKNADTKTQSDRARHISIIR